MNEIIESSAVYTSSINIDQLAKALALAQSEMTGALKDSENPFFKSSYADLASVLNDIKYCNKQGVAIIQMPFGGDDGSIGLTTLMAHSSGQWLSASFKMRPTKADPQGFGSCLTYMRRYAASAFCGVAQVDDDGNAASAKGPAETGIKYITEQQAAALETMISDVNADKQKLLLHFKFQSIDKIHADKFKIIVNSLEAKRLNNLAKNKEKTPAPVSSNTVSSNTDTGWGGLSPEELAQDIPYVG